MKQKVLILGAGKSSGALIDRLCDSAAGLNIEIRVGDLQLSWALDKTKSRPHTSAFSFDIHQTDVIHSEIADSRIVVSMLPASFHPQIARMCLQEKKHLITPSYVSEAMAGMDADVRNAGLLFLNEMGLDPGIDHMSAMELLDRLRAEGAEITGFSSHCGGLVAATCDTNRWHYKFSWNPRNVILAGQGDGMIQYLSNGELVRLPYEQLFASATRFDIPGVGVLESYPNRDSLKYRNAYGLQQVSSLYRGTFRVAPFCEGWQLLVRLGYTREKDLLRFDHSYSNLDALTELYMQQSGQIPGHHPVKDIIAWLGVAERPDLMDMLEEIDLWKDEPQFPAGVFNPARHLQQILEEKWKLSPEDCDRVVMMHEIYYSLRGSKKRVQSIFSMDGKDAQHTAMSATVGLPIALAVEMICRGEMNLYGVVIPVLPEIYKPIMQELRRLGVVFHETEQNSG